MSLKVTVKVGSVNNLSDARYCAGMGVDFIGFDFSSSKSQIVTPEKFKEIAEWLSGVVFVAEFTDTNVNEIENVIAETGLSTIQIDKVDLIRSLDHLQTKVLLTQNVNEIENIPGGLPIEYLVIDGAETITDSQLQAIRRLGENYNVLIGAGLSSENAESIVYETTAKGVNLKGGDEIRPGFKDYDELADILEALEEDF